MVIVESRIPMASIDLPPGSSATDVGNGVIRIACPDDAALPLQLIAEAARAAITSRRNAKIDANAGDSRAQRRLLMGAIGILNRVGKGRPRPSDAANMAALEAAEAAIEQIEADASAQLAAVDTALAAGDREALVGLIE